MSRASCLTALLASWLAPLAACAADERLDAHEEVATVLGRHFDHELAALALLEEHRSDPEAAELALEGYVAQHRVELAELATQRRLLEAEPHALAEALAAERERHTALFQRRERLAREAPELMRRERVHRALARIDGL